MNFVLMRLLRELEGSQRAKEKVDLRMKSDTSHTRKERADVYVNGSEEVNGLCQVKAPKLSAPVAVKGRSRKSGTYVGPPEHLK
jgi:hypothetical protein